MKLLLCPFIAVIAVGAISCSTPAVAPAPSTTTSEPEETTVDLANAKVPVVRSAYAEKNWGLPQITIYQDGGYRLIYRQGKTLNYLFIHGMLEGEAAPATAPPWSEESFDDKTGYPKMIRHPQEWQTSTILGKSVKWYQNDGGGGADFPLYKTVDFPAKSPDGRVGYYRIEVATTSTARAADLIKRVNW